MFDSDILTRTLLALGMILSGTGIYHLYNRVLRHRNRHLVTDLGPIRPMAFILIYFTTPTCIPCKTIQRPAIQQLSQMLGHDLQVIEIDASEQPQLAARWGVMSVPTTFLIDPQGKIRYINHGVARAEKLLIQVQS